MIISGLERTSFIDYPGKIATVLFSPGCNFSCYYCHNWKLLLDQSEKYTLDEVLSFLDTRKGKVDAVVFSGGEPTLQKGPEATIRQIRDLGFYIKLDTNGTNPQIVSHLIDEKLLDYIAMDIKAPANAKYAEVTGGDIDLSVIEQSIKLIMNSNVSYEFRTTYLPCLTQEDISSIASWIFGAKRYALQQYRRPQVEGKLVDMRLMDIPHSPQYIKETVALIANKVEKCDIRGI